MSRVPLIDATGVAALRKFIDSSHSHGTEVVLSGIRPQVAAILDRMHLDAIRADNFPAALGLAKTIIAGPAH